jgi:hypothetical protein
MGNLKCRETEYFLDISSKEQEDMGFKFDSDYGEYIYRFPVYKCDGVPTLFCRLIVDSDTHKVIFRIFDKNDSIYAAYYNRNKNNRLLPIIDAAVKKEFKRLGIKKRSFKSELSANI